VKRHIEIRPDTKIVHLGGRPPRVTLVLLVLCVGLFVLYAFADGPSWVAALCASGETTLGRLQLYQPFTALVLHLDARSLLFNMLALWIFGSALERWWGPRRFLLFWIVTSAAGLWIGVVVGQLLPRTLLYGSGGAQLGMMVATAIIFPHHLVFFFGLLPVKTRIIALSLAGFVVLGNLLAASYLEAVVEVVGAAVGLLFLIRRLPGQARARKAGKHGLDLIQGGKQQKKYWN